MKPPQQQRKSPPGRELLLDSSPLISVTNYSAITVLCVKSSGARVKFASYDTLTEAEAIVRRLAEVGCLAVIEVVR